MEDVFKTFNTIYPHIVAWLIYFSACFYSLNNIRVLSKINSNLTIRFGLVGVSLLITTVTVLFMGIQGFWINNSVIGDEPTTMMLLWTSFHYYNSFTYLVICVAIKAYIEWKTTLQPPSSTHRKEDWL